MFTPSTYAITVSALFLSFIALAIGMRRKKTFLILAGDVGIPMSLILPHLLNRTVPSNLFLWLAVVITVVLGLNFLLLYAFYDTKWFPRPYDPNKHTVVYQRDRDAGTVFDVDFRIYDRQYRYVGDLGVQTPSQTMLFVWLEDHADIHSYGLYLTTDESPAEIDTLNQLAVVKLGAKYSVESKYLVLKVLVEELELNPDDPSVIDRLHLTLEVDIKKFIPQESRDPFVAKAITTIAASAIQENRNRVSDQPPTLLESEFSFKFRSDDPQSHDQFADLMSTNGEFLAEFGFSSVTNAPFANECWLFEVHNIETRRMYFCTPQFFEDPRLNEVLKAEGDRIEMKPGQFLLVGDRFSLAITIHKTTHTHEGSGEIRSFTATIVASILPPPQE
jgi:hypothetical protein